MYKLHLIRKYLLKRRIAWVALVAVMLCTAMVLIVVSVMGGWLETFQNSFHAMTGDVVIGGRNPLVGFPHYRRMCDEVVKLPGVAAAVPTISSYGLINIGAQQIHMVQVIGYTADIGRVNPWPTLLHRQGAAIERGTTRPSFGLLPGVPYEQFLSDPAAKRTARNRPGMVVTGPVVGMTHGEAANNDYLRDVMVDLPVSLTLLPIAPNEGVDLQAANTKPFWIVDDVKSRVYQLDNQNVYVDFGVLQRNLRMDGGDGDPPRCTEIEIKAKPGFELTAVRDAVRVVADRVTAEAGGAARGYGYRVETWQEQQGDFIKAVQHEVVLTTALFGVISMVAVLLIFCIFYMIVVEKTRDIGILKSVGATATGILSLFLGYGLIIGVVGTGLGVLFAALAVWNINEAHAWLGRRMGIQIWSPKTYQFDRIPSHMETRTVLWVVAVALVSAVLGALLPAVRAATMNPVDSLRYE